jgi:uncharacterized protein (DUF1499 family)
MAQPHTAPAPRTARLGAACAAAALALCLAGALGHRWGLLGLRPALGAFTLGLLAAAVAAALSLWGLVAAWRRMRRGWGLAIGGLAVALAVLVMPVRMLVRARGLPPIHDISTDLEQPPAFVAVLPLRRAAPNPAEPGGPALAAAQRRAYPDIAPLRLSIPPRAAFQAARRAVGALRWTLVAEAPEEGRIEASDRTFWFGFVDDVVVRIVPEGGGSRVDVRSTSREGVGDLGTNAARVRRFLALLRQAE